MVARSDIIFAAGVPKERVTSATVIRSVLTTCVRRRPEPQWIPSRPTSNFAGLGAPTSSASWLISTDIHHPQFLTVTTYQALHSAHTGRKEVEEEDNETAESNGVKAEAEHDR